MAQATAPAEAALPQGRGQLPGFDFSDLLPERQAEDIVSGQVRVRLGRRDYVLAVLPIASNRRWKAGLEGQLVALLDVVERAGDDLAEVLSAFTSSTDDLLTVLYSYDTATDEGGQPTRPGVLPPRADLEEVATDAEVLLATLGVWSAANPFAAVALSAMRAAEATPLPVIEAPESASSTPMSSVPPSTGGRRRSSKRS